MAVNAAESKNVAIFRTLPLERITYADFRFDISVPDIPMMTILDDWLQCHDFISISNLSPAARDIGLLKEIRNLRPSKLCRNRTFPLLS